MPKYLRIGSYGQNQALRAHVWAENGPKTVETRPDSVHRDRIRIRTRPSYSRRINAHALVLNVVV
jgi:hypothetical protein